MLPEGIGPIVGKFQRQVSHEMMNQESKACPRGSQGMGRGVPRQLWGLLWR